MAATNDDQQSLADADLAWCHDAVQDVSRTFALTIDLLDEPMASHICVGYLLCRIPDTIEDAGYVPPEAGAALLRTYDDVLDPATDTSVDEFVEKVDPWLPEPGNRSDDWVVVANAPRVYRTYAAFDPDVREALRPPARELVDGMAQFVERYAEAGGLRLDTVEELEEYCHYAAGTVGTLVTNLVCRGPVDSEVEERLRETAESFGLLLQLVNVAKDVRVDYHEENNVYLPAAWLDDEGVAQDRVTHPENANGVATAVRRTAEHARSFLDEAHAYLETVPEQHGNQLAAWAVPYLLAVGTLRELSDRPEDVLSEDGVKVSRAEVAAIVTAATGTDRSSLSTLRNRVASRPFTDSLPAGSSTPDLS